MNTIELSFKANEKIRVGVNLIESIKGFITNSEGIHIITDENLLENQNLLFLHQSLLPHSTLHSVEPGEKSKSFTTLAKICEEILSHNPTKMSTIITFGGGVVGDIGGMVASILLRGINLIHIPTTLTAQVDSSIGGKCGINSKYGKNLIGAICSPHTILIDIMLLETLPREQLVLGCAEVIKYGLLFDSQFLSWFNDNLDHVLSYEKNALFKVCKRCCQLKLEVVKIDQYQLNPRRSLLNFGHSVGHAIEAASNYTIPHGQAIAIGIMVESQASHNIDHSILKETITNTGLPTSLKEIGVDLSVDAVYSHLLKDKKIKNGTLELAILENIGESYIEYVSCDFMHHLLNSYLG